MWTDPGQGNFVAQVIADGDVRPILLPLSISEK